RVSYAPAFRAPRDHHVQSAISSQREAPCKGLPLRDSEVFQRPGFPAVVALVNSSPEPRHVQNAGIKWALGIKQNMRGGGLVHSCIRLSPRFAAIFTQTDTAFIVRWILMPPHFWPRQVVSSAVHTPHSAFHLRVERQPIRRVQPFARNPDRRALPACASIFATKQTYVGVGKELTAGIERIELNAINSCYIQASAGPITTGHFAGIDR